MHRHAISKHSLALLCLTMGVALGGGLYEHMVMMPLWSAAPPASFSIIQPETGVPLDFFWIPVHAAISIFMIGSLILAWRERGVRKLLLIGLALYSVMRLWSAVYFIPEMLAFQEMPADGSGTATLIARVDRWTRLSWLRTPLDLGALSFFLLAWRRYGPARMQVA